MLLVELTHPKYPDVDTKVIVGKDQAQEFLDRGFQVDREWDPAEPAVADDDPAGEAAAKPNKDS